MFKISDQAANFIASATENWRVKLAAEEEIIMEVIIQRGIFQGDLLRQLKFLLQWRHWIIF